MSVLIQTHALILASKSEPRKKILEKTGLEFTVIDSGIDETKIKEKYKTSSLKEVVLELAKAKALAVSDQFPESIVIGADQVCCLSDQLLGKPKTEELACQQLIRLSGKTHHLYCGVSLYHNKKQIWSTVERASLTMRALTKDECRAYVELDQPLQSCGAYKFESYGCHLFKSVTGSSDQIQGLPLLSLLTALRRYGVYTLNYKKI